MSKEILILGKEAFDKLKPDVQRFIKQQSQHIADLMSKLAESEKSKESYRLQNEHHHLQLLQFYSRLGVEAFGADIHEKALETLMIMKEQLAEKDKAIENWQTMYESVVQTCHNDKEEIERLNKQLAEKEKEIEYQESMKILAVENQNKKAIEQLEKVKELLNTDFESTISWIDPYEDGEYLNSMTYNHNNTIKIIDNQIKQLKEKNNG